MAYDPNSPLLRGEPLGRVGNAGTRNDSTKFVYRYATADTAAVVEGAAYFPVASVDFLGRGDRIEAVMNCGIGATPVTKTYVVTQGKASGDAANVIAVQQTTAG